MGRLTNTDSIIELERRFGVTSDELRDWLAPSPCDSIPAWEIHRWIALLAVIDKENE